MFTVQDGSVFQTKANLQQIPKSYELISQKHVKVIIKIIFLAIKNITLQISISVCPVVLGFLIICIFCN